MQRKSDGSVTAVDVRKLTFRQLSWDAVGRGIVLEDLPLASIDPQEEIDRTAVLSWRWDRDLYSGRSRNVGLALKYAKESGIDWLCFDFVSIRQEQNLESLLSDVVRFGSLFRVIPVLCAYDRLDHTSVGYQRCLSRPWILFELRQICVNPTRVTHVGFATDKIERRELSFENEVWDVKRSGFAEVIYEVLHGTVEMTNIRDFSLILPAFASIFKHLFTTLTREDYLLAAFLVSSHYQHTQTVQSDDGNSLDNGMRMSYGHTCLDSDIFQRFSLGEPRGGRRSYEWRNDVLFDQQKVATLITKMTSSFDRIWIKTEEEDVAALLTQAGLPRNSIDEFRKRRDENMECIYVDRSLPGPVVSERLATFEKRDWIDVRPPNSCSLNFYKGILAKRQ